MGVFLRQKGDLLVRNPQQQPSIQETYHHKSFARSQRHLGLHDQSAARQGARTRQKIESPITPHQPDRQPEQGQEQKKNAHGLYVAAPAERGVAQRGGLSNRGAGGGVPRQINCLSRGALHSPPHDLPGLFQAVQHMFPGKANRFFQPRHRRRGRGRAVHQTAHSLPRKAGACCDRHRRSRASQAALPAQWG